jgi:hypothetical protein
MNKIILTTLIFVTVVAVQFGVRLLPEFNKSTPGETVCLTRKSSYDAIVKVANLPDIPNLKSEKGGYLDLGYAYRFWGKNTFVLSTDNSRCGKVVDPHSLYELTGDKQLDLLFIVPPNSNSVWPHLIKISVVMLMILLFGAFIVFNRWLSTRYIGNWRGGAVDIFIPEDYSEVRRDIRKFLGMEP